VLQISFNTRFSLLAILGLFPSHISPMVTRTNGFAGWKGPQVSIIVLVDQGTQGPGRDGRMGPRWSNLNLLIIIYLLTVLIKDNNSTWIKGNWGYYGYYIVNYDDSNWDALKNQLTADHKVFVYALVGFVNICKFYFHTCCFNNAWSSQNTKT
jgi:hypothetical protein